MMESRFRTVPGWLMLPVSLKDQQEGSEAGSNFFVSWQTKKGAINW